MKKNEQNIIIYQNTDGNIKLDVHIQDESVWVKRQQMAILFGRDVKTIGKHVNNVFAEGELERSSTVAKFATVQNEGARKVERLIEYYNLDVVISVGYRVKSLQGTQFRIWANKILKDYLVKGYAVNEQLLQHKTEQLKDLQETVKIISSVLNQKTLSGDESKGLLKLISDYSFALDILDRYDYKSLEINNTSENEIYKISYREAIAKINIVRDKFGNSKLFGNEKDASFKSSISTIYQTFNGKDLYPSIEEKAANLLYFITKNHSFTDGNKRIAAIMFIIFLKETEFYLI
jgi:prophage maintenance system killer protein